MPLTFHEAHVVVGAPLASSEVVGKMETWDHPFMVVDEAGCMIELIVMFLPSHFPNTPTVFLGDVKPFGPLDGLHVFHHKEGI